MLPKSQIIIKPNGDSHVEGMEQSDDCHKLNEMANDAGKVTSQEDKEHQPVYQDINRKES